MINILSNHKIKNKKHILQFVPKDLKYLTNTKKITWEGISLKTEYLINIIHYMLTRYYFSDKKELNLSSIVLRKWYGTHYNYYIEFLVGNNILFKTNNYFAGVKCNTYSLNEEYYKMNMNNIIRCKNENSFLLKKWRMKQLDFNIDSLNEQIMINPWVKKQVIQDLFYVKIDYQKALDKLNDMYLNKDFDSDKSYIKNLMSIESIKDGSLFYVEDQYGRLHTNFTILKKIIRKEFITINNQEVEELDIVNSQPLFLSVLLKEKNFHLKYPKEFEYYKDVVKKGIIYDILGNEINIDRNECKKKMFFVLFGENKWDTKIDNAFKKFFPEIYQWIKDYKFQKYDYKVIAHELQRKESKLIFDNIIYTLKKKIPDIKVFTVHDSIIYPKIYKCEVEKIFYDYVNKLFN